MLSILSLPLSPLLIFSLIFLEVFIVARNRDLLTAIGVLRAEDALNTQEQ